MHLLRRDGESFEEFFGRYKRTFAKSGILAEEKRRRFYLSPGESRRKKEKVAERRRKRRVRNELRRSQRPRRTAAPAGDGG